MTDYSDAFKDIPGTVVFDATQSRLGFHLNQFCMSLMKPQNRAAFAADGFSFQNLASKMSGVSEDEYRNMMVAGGRSPEGHRSKTESQK